MQPFAIISSPRSGTGFLREVLNTHPDICCNGEIFHNDDNTSFNAIDSKLSSNSFIGLNIRHLFISNKILFLFLKRNFPLFLFNNIVEMNTKYQLMGFKIFPGHSEKILQFLTSDQRNKIIVLERKNTLRTYVSELIAKATNEWVSFTGNTKIVKVSVDFDSFITFHNRYIRYFSSVRNSMIQSNVKFINLYYEDIITNFPHSAINNHLGTPPVLFSTDTKITKQNPYILKEIVSNFDSLQRRLDQNGLSYLMEE